MFGIYVWFLFSLTPLASINSSIMEISRSLCRCNEKKNKKKMPNNQRVCLLTLVQSLELLQLVVCVCAMILDISASNCLCNRYVAINNALQRSKYFCKTN
ncbi:uncharacterized protein ASCRUDRAFT_149508 [Ascoidea rubescens DSM 1968]|uniref:Uncharacterized protein n=1 Tax=Ascoidea rubescens DSM 1968 TaxID=1344418 RepID=A0A1D2VGC7_9ASCO|nr:hypothetical protein ASCRUDRAFT_149508 [Ascoidea rubescens DSM 1968]ODV60685.1 hypothetical protein ASCRUDRAFT_149508 [Ascoidea rubescens DSM 1968]